MLTSVSLPCSYLAPSVCILVACGHLWLISVHSWVLSLLKIIFHLNVLSVCKYTSTSHGRLLAEQPTEHQHICRRICQNWHKFRQLNYISILMNTVYIYFSYICVGHDLMSLIIYIIREILENYNTISDFRELSVRGESEEYIFSIKIIQIFLLWNILINQ